MQNIPDLLYNVKHTYPDACPQAGEPTPGTGYSVAGAFVRYCNERGILNREACHDLAIMPGNTPRFPDSGLLAEVLTLLNPTLSDLRARECAATIINQSEKRHIALAYRALERALMPVPNERTPL